MLQINKRICSLEGLVNLYNFNHLTFGTCFYCLLQLVSTSPIYFILKPELNSHFTSLFSTFISITVTLEICKSCTMVPAKVNRELTNLGADLTRPDTSASENLSQSLPKMKCYYCHRYHCFLDFCNNTIPDDAVFYSSDIPFQYSEREGM